MKRTLTYILLGVTALVSACTNSNQDGGSTNEHNTIALNEQTRIVSLNGTVTEVLCALGLEQYIQAVDETSTFPESVKELPKAGHNRSFSAEMILAQRPTVVIGTKELIKPELVEQINGAGVPLVMYNHEHSVESGKELIRRLADTFGVSEKGAALIATIDQDLRQVQKPATAPKVMCIYARGAGILLAAGENTAPYVMIELAGGENAIKGFTDFKPLTAEALVQANPDVILMFEKGLVSVGGMEGLLQIPGISETNAGRNKQVIEMDGLFLTGFGPRTGKAVDFLSKKLNEVPAR